MMENTLYRLQNRLGLTIAYFGGSITEGAGASCYENSWAGKTTAYLRKAYPACEITPVQAAIGGTGSLLGVYRCDTDVCAYHPDLVFFEYAVNDSSGDFAELCRNADAIFRKIWSCNPYADIVVVYTIERSLSDRMMSGGIQQAKTAFSAEAFHYGLLQIDIGEVLLQRILTEGGDDAAWKHYTCDDVHPNDTGYQIYADTVCTHLEEAFRNAGSPQAPVPKAIPAPPFPSEISHVGAHMEDCVRAQTDAHWTVVEESLCGRYSHYLECTEPGGTLTFSFDGTRVDVYWMMAPDSGDVFVSIDDGAERRISSWDRFCTYRRASLGGLFSGLNPGTHRLILRVADDKNEKSEGHAIRIGAFLVL